MPILHCYVSSEAYAKMVHFGLHVDPQGRDVTKLAEDAIEDTAMKAVTQKEVDNCEECNKGRR